MERKEEIIYFFTWEDKIPRLRGWGFRRKKYELPPYPRTISVGQIIPKPKPTFSPPTITDITSTQSRGFVYVASQNSFIKAWTHMSSLFYLLPNLSLSLLSNMGTWGNVREVRPCWRRQKIVSWQRSKWRAKKASTTGGARQRQSEARAASWRAGRRARRGWAPPHRYRQLRPTLTHRLLSSTHSGLPPLATIRRLKSSLACFAPRRFSAMATAIHTDAHARSPHPRARSPATAAALSPPHAWEREEIEEERERKSEEEYDKWVPQIFYK